ncbi:hypothetical protein ACKFKG_33340 [Phormidesmis sp. 146-35]
MRLRTALLGVGAAIAVLSTNWSAIAQTVVSIPPVIEALTPTTDQSSPDIKILSPQPGATVNSTEVLLQLSARRFAPGKDPATGLGLHFKVIVDNNSPIDYFDPSKPLKLNLSPGTHTIRVVSARPWNQSYRNRGSQAHVTFNVQQSDGKNIADYNQPVGLITVVSPVSGTYGAEPILLDYLVDGVNLGRTASVRYTLNGRSVKTTDRFPLYLTGLQPGQNSLVVELLGASGQVRPNAGFNRVERTIFYQPGGQDSLAKLIRGELKPKDLKGAVGPNPFIFDAQGTPRPLK